MTIPTLTHTGNKQRNIKGDYKKEDKGEKERKKLVLLGLYTKSGQLEIRSAHIGEDHTSRFRLYIFSAFRCRITSPAVPITQGLPSSISALAAGLGIATITYNRFELFIKDKQIFIKRSKFVPLPKQNYATGAVCDRNVVRMQSRIMFPAKSEHYNR